MNCNSAITYDMDCNIVVHDVNFDENYAYVYVLQLNKSDEIITRIINKENIEDLVVFDIGLDGFYTLITIKVPKDQTLEYYYKDGKIYHIEEEVDLAVLLELNPEVSGLLVTPEYYFLTCHLRKCYINICLLIFDLVHSVSCNKPPLDQNLIYKRDLFLSAINIIEFMTERDLYNEAELLLERIMNCSGLCNDCNSTNRNSSRSCSCGC